MNLLDEKWIPIKRTGGKQDWIAPYQMTEPDIVSLDARRPDFNGALIQFLIGLVQTTTPMDSHVEWVRWNTQPPTADELKRWFEPVREAFVFDGDGARFMQDYSLRTDEVTDDEFNEIGALLIESPGNNTLKENIDHFIKRGNITLLCSCCAITSLFTLQTNAPSGGGGGDGFLTSIRGGGPLTTILIANESEFLWKTVWLNIREKNKFLTEHGDADKNGMHFIFPWMKEMATVRLEVTPIQVHPAHIFWGMPRRIRLDFEQTARGTCQTCGRTSEKLLVRYFTKTGGFDYKGEWKHPLSPYSENKKGDVFPVHLKPDGIGYKHWLSWILGFQNEKNKTQPASVVSYVLEGRRLKNQPYRLWAFGYNMKKASTRCWYESTLPLYGLVERNLEGKQIVQREISKWLESANFTSFLLRSNVKLAWFGDDADTRGDLSFIDASFWAQTEPYFYKKLNVLIEQARDEENDPILMPLREAWREVLIKVTERLFDADLVGAAPIERQNPHRVAKAYNKLRFSLRGDKLKEMLGLPFQKIEKKKKSAKSAS